MMGIAQGGKAIANEMVLWGLNSIGRFMPLNGVPVLHYHSVDGENQASVTRQNFYAQMKYLRDHRINVISLHDLVDYLNGKKIINEESVVITFDDGYKTNYRIAFPILREFKFTATIFLTSGRVGGTSDWERLKGVSELPLMSWREVREMSNYGIDFGAHTDTHPHLTRISLNKIREEIVLSKKKIEDGLLKPVYFFAYPYGEYNSEVKKLVQEINFTAACSTEPGLNRHSQDFFTLKRSGIFRDVSLPGFRTRLSGTYQWYFYIKRRIRGKRKR